CQCNGHSTCVNGSVCEQCRNLTTGPHCETCMPGYHGDPTNGGKCQDVTQKTVTLAIHSEEPVTHSYAQGRWSILALWHQGRLFDDRMTCHENVKCLTWSDLTTASMRRRQESKTLKPVLTSGHYQSSLSFVTLLCKHDTHYSQKGH
ncbi:hypothetical protein GOODEAATRI_010737, partial [Goodea atripinnis]